MTATGSRSTRVEELGSPLAGRLAWVWFALVFATVAAVVVGEVIGGGSGWDSAIATEFVLLVAVVKIRFVAADLMGVRAAPRALWIALHVWCAAALTLLAVVYVLRR